jgi:Concanavalin A-like lectin/glucanases superfamily
MNTPNSGIKPNNALASKIQQAAQTQASQVAQGAQTAVQKAQTIIKNAANKNATVAPVAADGAMVKNATDTAIVILVVLVLLVIVLILVYIIRLFGTSSLKRIDLLKKTISLDSRTALPYIIPAGRMAVTTRGQEFSYSMWLYLSENYKASDMHKLVFMRGNTSNSFTDVDAAANPVVMLDGKSNAMFFALSTTATPAGATYNLNCIARTPSSSCALTAATNHLVVKMEYVPLQRWVNCVLVVRDNIVTLFVDGDIYSIITTNDVKINANQARPLIRGTAGDLLVGDPNYPVNGFLSKLEFYNYALSHKQVQDMYKGGPVASGLLSKLGFGSYGVRSPIYNLDNVSA